jgi:hypothetical protein
MERTMWTRHATGEKGELDGKNVRSGFVEPDPEVFARLAELGCIVLAWLPDSELDVEAMRIEYADGIQGYVREWEEELRNGRLEEADRILRYLQELGVVDPELTNGDPAAVRVASGMWYDRMTDLRMKLDRPVPVEPMKPLWERQVRLCSTLEKLARKQLKHEAFGPGDRIVLRGLSEELRILMGCPPSGVAADDAPRTAPVVWDPIRKKVRLVSHRRPRELWILYPFGDERIPCRGVVLTYREQEVPIDSDWESRIAAADEPAWITRK